VSAVFRSFRGEARLVRRDAGALLILVGAIVLYSVFYPLPYLREVLRKVDIVVVDQDHSALSRRLIRMADAHDLIHVSRAVTTLVEGEDLVRRGEAAALLLVPRDFERHALRGERARAVAFVDASCFLPYRQALTGLLQASGTLSAAVEVKRFEAGGASLAQATAWRDPIPLVTQPLFNAAEGYATYVVPAVLVLILQQTLLVGLGLIGGTRTGHGLAREAEPRQESGLAVLAGRTLFYVLLYGIHTWYDFALVPRFYGFPMRGRAIVLAALTLPFLLSVVWLGLGLRGLFTRRETALQVLLFTSVPALFLAAFAWPVEALPAWLRLMSLAIPSTNAIPAFLRVSAMGASLAEVSRETTVLWWLSGIYGALAWWSSAREARRRSPSNA
jgi:ABC-2 type transport system permease protein